MRLICGSWISDSWHHICSSGVAFNGKLSIWLRKCVPLAFLIRKSILVMVI